MEALRKERMVLDEDRLAFEAKLATVNIEQGYYQSVDT
jgi:hypothetical protein